MEISPKTSKTEVDLALKYLSKNRLMSLATASGNRPWATTVFFAYDKDFNIFFYSKEDTKHCEDILKNPNVAITFNQYTGKSFNIKGMQIIGKASKVTQNKTRAFAIFLARHPWAIRFAKDHTLYIIRSEEVYYIDQELHGHFHRVRIM